MDFGQLMDARPSGFFEAASDFAQCAENVRDNAVDFHQRVMLQLSDTSASGLWSGEAARAAQLPMGDLQLALNRAADQLVREALLALSSDWAFMVTKDSAADYARRRAQVHGERFAELAKLLTGGDAVTAADRANELRGQDYPFGQLDARGL
jgi:hypothetical protein